MRWYLYLCISVQFAVPHIILRNSTTGSIIHCIILLICIPVQCTSATCLPQFTAGQIDIVAQKTQPPIHINAMVSPHMSEMLYTKDTNWCNYIIAYHIIQIDRCQWIINHTFRKHSVHNVLIPSCYVMQKQITHLTACNARVCER